MHFYDWVSLELPGGRSDTFIFRMSPTDGLPPADYAGVIRSIVHPLRRLRKGRSSLWIHAPREGSDAMRASRRRIGSISIHAPREGSDRVNLHA